MIIIIINIMVLGIDDFYNYCNYYWDGPGRADPEQLRCVIIMIILMIVIIIVNYNCCGSGLPRPA